MLSVRRTGGINNNNKNNNNNNSFSWAIFFSAIWPFVLYVTMC